jgi:hypothetical protein
MHFMALWENHGDTSPTRDVGKVKLSLVLFGEGRDNRMGTRYSQQTSITSGTYSKEYVYIKIELGY